MQLFERDVAPVLVLSGGAAWQALEEGLPCDGTHVICVAPEPSTTAGEAPTISSEAKRRGWTSIAVVTSTYQPTRSRIVFGQCFSGELAMVEALSPWPIKRSSGIVVRDASP